ncbi:hypothetical protein V2G26_019390 [Clonostachys chloroleuca]
MRKGYGSAGIGILVWFEKAGWKEAAAVQAFTADSTAAPAPPAPTGPIKDLVPETLPQRRPGYLVHLASERGGNVGAHKIGRKGGGGEEHFD